MDFGLGKVSARTNFVNEERRIMGKSSGVQKNLANCSANQRRSSGMIFLSYLQKVNFPKTPSIGK